MQVMMDGESISPDECTEEYGWQAAFSKRMSTKSAVSGDSVGAVPNACAASRTFEKGNQVKNRVTRASRMPYMPKDHFKIILLPRGGINISKMGSTKVGKAIIEAAGLGSDQTASDMICPNVSQNIMVASTPERENAERRRRRSERAMAANAEKEQADNPLNLHSSELHSTASAPKDDSKPTAASPGRSRSRNRSRSRGRSVSRSRRRSASRSKSVVRSGNRSPLINPQSEGGTGSTWADKVKELARTDKTPTTSEILPTTDDLPGPMVCEPNR
ncbi:hypothetical protein HPB51_008714 [Rhipicephalus microplus]|uniref:Uncharacterized protein n=1 Tax=Rhipicephalus microplus TaxID=6941 RepID=A0A9J6EZ33_RHIMP|nr:hypothetical protein HPB51_008714 [Rhipicephalus microplus]